MNERSGIMKNTLVLIFSLFLLSSLNCTTTKPDVSEMKTDLSGTWILTENRKGCGDQKITSTVEINQKGDSVTVVNSEGNMTIGRIYGNTILFAGIEKVSSEGAVASSIEIHDHTLRISEDATALTGKVKWILKNATSGNCDGITTLTYKRKLK
jgi:hypothetical protein